MFEPVAISRNHHMRGRSSRGRSAARPNRQILPLFKACVEVLEGRTLFSTYYVSAVAPAGGNGSAGAPFQTIQQATGKAVYQGDVVDIEPGTYRETIVPRGSGITFQYYDPNGTNQPAVVSGADVVKGFSDYSGSIYSATSPDNLGGNNNQVFVDGQMVTEARWPANTVQSTVNAYSSNTIYDSSITQGNGYWTNATIHITPGYGWVSYTGTVTGSGPGWLSVSLPSLSQSETPTAGNRYYLTGTYNALNSVGQWYMNNAGSLYLNDPSGDSPANHLVEVKARADAFNLAGVSNTTISGLSIFAATIETNWQSTGTVIDGINASYITHFVDDSNGWTISGPDGIELNGSGSELKNSTIAYSAGDGVWVGTNNVTVDHNVIHDVDYSATDGAGIRTYSSNVTMNNNTIYNTGRDGINVRGPGSKIFDNIIHDFMQLTDDGGGIYTHDVTSKATAPANGEFSYNQIYNARTFVNIPGFPSDAVGIFLDDDSAGFSVHDNTIWNVDAGFKANNTSTDEQIYNNNFAAHQHATEVGHTPPFTWTNTSMTGNVFANNSAQFGVSASNTSGNVYAQPGLAVTSTTATSVSLGWPTSGTYSLWRKDTPVGQLGEFIEIATGVNGTSYTDSTNITSGNTYYYELTSATAPTQSDEIYPTSAIPSASGSGRATFVKTDTTTQGNWASAYGADGYNLLGSSAGGGPGYVSYPNYANVTATGQGDYIWSTSTASTNSDPRALQIPSSANRIASQEYSYNSFAYNLTLTGGTHQVAFYLLDWDGSTANNNVRAETVQVSDSATGTVLDTQTVANFQNGEYLVWNLSGNVTIKITKTAGDNATASGLFFGSGTASTNSASFVKTDTTTQGNWASAYGADGYDLLGSAAAGGPAYVSYPGYATVTASGQAGYVWQASTTDARALRFPTSSSTQNGIASQDCSTNSFAYNLTLTGGTHQVALYLLDWDSTVRKETVQITDAATGAVLDTRTASGFHGGEYLVWNLSGDVKITITNVPGSGDNATASGLFFG